MPAPVPVATAYSSRPRREVRPTEEEGEGGREGGRRGRGEVRPPEEERGEGGREGGEAT